VIHQTDVSHRYPFMHLLPDGSLFMFTSKSSEIFDVAGKKTVKSLPDLVNLPQARMIGIH